MFYFSRAFVLKWMRWFHFAEIRECKSTSLSRQIFNSLKLKTREHIYFLITEMHTIPVLNAFLFIELHRELLKTCLLSSPFCCFEDKQLCRRIKPSSIYSCPFGLPAHLSVWDNADLGHHLYRQKCLHSSLLLPWSICRLQVRSPYRGPPEEGVDLQSA